jgi:hypothetical protein
VTYGLPQDSSGVTLDNYGVDRQAGHLNFADHLAFHQNARFREAASLIEFLHFESLIGVRISKDEAGVAQRENAEDEEKVASTTEDIGLR